MANFYPILRFGDLWDSLKKDQRIRFFPRMGSEAVEGIIIKVNAICCYIQSSTPPLKEYESSENKTIWCISCFGEKKMLMQFLDPWKKEELTIEKLLPKEKIYSPNSIYMSSLVEKFINLNLQEPEKSFKKLNIIDDSGLLTPEGHGLFLAWIFNKYKNEFKTEVVDPILESEKECKKK